MLVHLFGATSSPSCAGYALRRTAADNESEHNVAAVETVRNNFYVDDCLKSVKTTEEAIELSSQLRELLAKGGFRLTKWLSNDRQVLEKIPKSERAATVFNLDLQELPVERTLGVLWNVETDKFTFNIKVKERPNTRRGILSTTSSVYDPLGFVAPFILVAKMLLQDICTQGLGWDQEVSSQDLSRWTHWLEELPQLRNVSINRCLRPTVGEHKHDLHVFCDASQRGYAAVAYLRSTCQGNTHCAFVLGKTRLSPLKVMTIPRLELSAAVLACAVSQTIRKELEIPVKGVTFWTDSTSVLQYIRNESRRFHTFVANRIEKIHAVSDPSQWRYVDTKSNLADEGSRGIHACEITEDCMWLRGPEFLWKADTEWPIMPVSIDNKDLEFKTPPVHSLACRATMMDVILRYSTWTKLLKGLAWLLKFKKYLLRN
ncbi:uncharacterized protein LOC117110650 [Anneissia japonica]|uniref:uncharacterized protein LOC117110650 n=1 Tax=Anneissia japonica TaxID=1529436 RepID=UPI0014258935|nr:uncharacterized protein LOC117110650 [Anneissia japonica]